MISNKRQLLEDLDFIERGLVSGVRVRRLREAVQRLDEMDDLVDAVCSCRTQEIPVLRMRDDDAPGRP